MATFCLQGPVSIKVQVPNMQDKTEWKLNGQVLVFTLPLTDQVWCCGEPRGRGQLPPADLSKGMNDLSLVPQVSVIKVKIHEATGMPAGKQKLQYEVGWVSDPAPWVPTPLPSQKLNPLWNQRSGEKPGCGPLSSS